METRAPSVPALDPSYWFWTEQMLRWNILWWCFLLLGLQNVFTTYQLRRTPFEGNETQCIAWGEWSWVFSNLPFDYLDPLVWSTPLACPWDPHAESDVIKCPISYTAESWWSSLESGNPFKLSHSYIAEIQARRDTLIRFMVSTFREGRKIFTLVWILFKFSTSLYLIPVDINMCVCVCWNLPWHSCMFNLESKTQWNVNC